MKIHLTSVFVDDQVKALAFYTEILGFVTKHDVPIAGTDRWLTVVSPDELGGTELLLEPAGHPAVKPYRDMLAKDGIPLAQFAVDDVQAEYERLRDLGVHFTQEPLDMGTISTAVFDDTCGNLIQIATKPQ
ncbi:VOC family protein [Streptomyces sp. NPDC057302]|uniref:VOC family protein n=1 Tax=Streptomyces sp. NPDC057302 TaxID=3346094 RepID=UPI00363E1C3C